MFFSCNKIKKDVFKSSKMLFLGAYFVILLSSAFITLTANADEHEQATGTSTNTIQPRKKAKKENPEVLPSHLPIKNIQFTPSKKEKIFFHHNDERDEELRAIILQQLFDPLLWEKAKVSAIQSKIESAYIVYDDSKGERQHSPDFYDSLESALLKKMVQTTDISFKGCAYSCVQKKTITITQSRLIISTKNLNRRIRKEIESGEVQGILKWSFFSNAAGSKGGISVSLLNANNKIVWTDTIFADINELIVADENKASEGESQLGIALMSQRIQFEAGTNPVTESNQNVVVSFGYRERITPFTRLKYYLGGRVLYSTGLANNYFAISASARIGYTIFNLPKRDVDFFIGFEQDLILVQGFNGTLAVDWQLSDAFYLRGIYELPLDSERTDNFGQEYTLSPGFLLEMGVKL